MFGYFFLLLSALGARYHLAFSLPLLLTLDQQGASEMYRDPRWSDISWNIKQAHKGAKEKLHHDHDMIKVLPAKKKSASFCPSRFHAVCDLCADKEHKRHHQGKMVKAWGRYVYPHDYSGCILLSSCPSENEQIGFIAPEWPTGDTITEPDKLLNRDDFYCRPNGISLKFHWPRRCS